MSTLWRNVLERIDPELFSLGSVSVSWYGVCFLLGGIVALVFFRRLTRRGASEDRLTDGAFFDCAMLVTLGAVAGARIGYAAIYNPAFFLEYPLAIFSPFDPETGVWTGIAGMSAHGGMAGALLGLWVFSRKERMLWWSLADKLALSAPLAIFFGRIGNFLVGELPGRPTDASWGIVFPRALDGQLRHPSPLYEAFGEGLLLFLFLRLLSKKRRPPGELFAWSLGLYGAFRFALEYFREPDPQLGFFWGSFTMGQWLSLALIAVSGTIVWWLRARKNAILFPRRG